MVAKGRVDTFTRDHFCAGVLYHFALTAALRIAIRFRHHGTTLRCRERGSREPFFRLKSVPQSGGAPLPDRVSAPSRPSSLLVDIIHDEAGDTMIDDLGHRSATKGNHWGSQAAASIRANPNGSGQSIGNNSAIASPRKACFWLSPISPTNSTRRSSSSGFTLL